MIRIAQITLAVLLFLVSQPKADYYTITVDANMSDLLTDSVGTLDTVIVDDGTVLTIDVNHTDTTCLLMFVRQGGVIKWGGGKRANFGGLWLGGNSGSPFNDFSGGAIVMRNSDTVGIYELDVMDNLYTWGDFVGYYYMDSLIFSSSSASEPVVIMGIGFPAPDVFINAFGTPPCSLDNVEIRNFGNSNSANGRQGFAVAYHDQADESECYINNVKLYNAHLNLQGFDNITIDSIFSYRWMDTVSSGYSFSLYQNAAADYDVFNVTLSNSYFWVDNEGNGEVEGGGAWIYGCDTCRIENTEFVQVNRPSVGQELRHGILVENRGSDGDNVELYNVKVDSFQFGLDIQVDSFDVDTCRFVGNSHENVFITDGASDYELTRSVLGGPLAGGRASLTFYTGAADTGRRGDIHYNTIFTTNGSGPGAVEFGYPSGYPTSAWEDMSFVGNVMLNTNASWDSAGITIQASIPVSFAELKNNSWINDFYLYSGADTTQPGYDPADSNLYDQTIYDFADSLNDDYTLGSSSPMINAGDSAIWDDVWNPADPSEAPGDIGAYQYTEGETPPAGTDEILNLLMGLAWPEWPLRFCFAW